MPAARSTLANLLLLTTFSTEIFFFRQLLTFDKLELNWLFLNHSLHEPLKLEEWKVENNISFSLRFQVVRQKVVSLFEDIKTSIRR